MVGEAKKTIVESKINEKYEGIEVEVSDDPMVTEVEEPEEEFIAPDTKEPETDKKEPETKKPDKKVDEKEVKADEKEEDKPKDEEEPGKDEDEKYSKRVQKRIDKLTYDRKSADERAETAEAELTELKKKDAATETPVTEEDKKVVADRAKLEKKYIEETALKQAGEKPTEDQFDNLDDYTIALSRWSANVTLYEDKAKGDLETKRGELREQALTFKKRMDKGFELYDDFEEVAFAPMLGITHAMIAVMQDVEDVAALSYWFGKNPKDVARISRMNPTSMAREIGKIEARFISDPESKPTETPPKTKKTISSAPEPIDSISSSTTSKKDPTKMSPEEYRQWREGGGGT